MDQNKRKLAIILQAKLDTERWYSRHVPILIDRLRKEGKGGIADLFLALMDTNIDCGNKEPERN